LVTSGIGTLKTSHKTCPSVFSFQQPSPFCHPERTRISYLIALTGATYVVLRKENHMQLTEATTLDRKSGEAEGSAVPRTSPGNVFSRGRSDPVLSRRRHMRHPRINGCAVLNINPRCVIFLAIKRFGKRFEPQRWPATCCVLIRHHLSP
jgi:hypothetical protein